MLTFVVALVLVLGVNTILWTTVGATRVVSARIHRVGADGRGRRALRRGLPAPVPRGYRPPTTADVAVLVAAHNEELVIERTIRSAAEHLPPEQILVVSDGSSDRTVEIARAAGAQVYDLHPNRGKAGAIAAAIEHFSIPERFEVMMLLDADTHLSTDYFTTGLPEFSAPDVVAVAGRATTILEPRAPTFFGRLLVACRSSARPHPPPTSSPSCPASPRCTAPGSSATSTSPPRDWPSRTST
jgi:biofilm PGA synthesis N-glycosyltransferase PgaC